VPARLRNPADPTLIWRSLPAGDLAELVLLDTRYTGRDRQAGDEDSPPLHDPERSLLGDAQRRWLAERVTDRSHRWVLVASGVVVNCLELPLPGTAVFNPIIPNGYAVLDGKVLHDDQWDGYPVERDHLIEALEHRRGRAVLLSGDVHSSWAFEGPSKSDQPPVAVEFTAPAVTSAPMGRTKLPGLWRILDDAADRLPHVTWADVTRRGFVVLDVTPDAVQAEWWFVNPYDLDLQPELGAAWRTGDTWPPRLEEAAEPSHDPVRPGLPADLPARPGDLRALRRRHRVRRVLGGTALTAAVAAVAVPAAEALRRRLAH
jgi:alkaline phosphatase D